MSLEHTMELQNITLISRVLHCRKLGVDVNKDGNIGSLTAIESEGSVALNSDTSGKLYANSSAIRDCDGIHISTSHYAGWRIGAAETIDGTNNRPWEYTASGKDSTGAHTQHGTGHLILEFYVGSVDSYTAETQFGVDVNKDGTIGAPEPEPTLVQIESEGSVTLNKDTSGKLYANSSAIRP